LAEIRFGAWEGLSWNDVKRLWPELATAKSADWLGVTPPDGESWLDLVNRAGRALAKIRLGPFPAAVIAHQMTNGALIHVLSGGYVANFRQDYCQVLCVELGGLNAEVPNR
jgi:broad specificity phosphatase PhoE